MEFDRSLTLASGQKAYIRRASNKDKTRTAEKDNLYFLHSQVSKDHAMIVNEEGKLFIADQESSFGTVLNDKYIRPHQLMEVKNEDVIGLSMSKSIESISRVIVNSAVPKSEPIRLEDFKNPKTMLTFRVSVVDIPNDINSDGLSPLLVSFELIDHKMYRTYSHTPATDMNVTTEGFEDEEVLQPFDGQSAPHDPEEEAYDSHDGAMSVDDESGDAVVVDSDSEDEDEDTRSVLRRLVTGDLYDEIDEEEVSGSEYDRQYDRQCDREINRQFFSDYSQESDQEDSDQDSESDYDNDSSSDSGDSFVITVQAQKKKLTAAELEDEFQAQKDEALQGYLSGVDPFAKFGDKLDQSDDACTDIEDNQDVSVMEFDSDGEVVATSHQHLVSAPSLNYFYNMGYQQDEDESDEDYQYNSDDNEAVYYVFDQAAEDTTDESVPESPSRVKSIVKEAAKGVGYAAATILVLGAYGSTLAEGK